jgi:hypothetical protein
VIVISSILCHILGGIDDSSIRPRIKIIFARIFATLAIWCVGVLFFILNYIRDEQWHKWLKYGGTWIEPVGGGVMIFVCGLIAIIAGFLVLFGII